MIRSTVVLVSVVAAVANGQGCETVAGYNLFPDEGANGGTCYDTTFAQCVSACEATTQCSAFDWRGPQRCCNFMNGPPVNLVIMKGLCTYIKSGNNPDIPLDRWYSRSVWGAGPSRGCSTAAMSPGNITIHHTAGAAISNATAGQARCRGIQSFHQNDNGWCDIGYHFLVDLAGNIYQGRPFAAPTSWPAPGSAVPPLVVGAHAGGANTNNIGISVMANFGSNAVMQRGDTAYNTVVLLSAHLALGYGISINTVTVRGHRDWVTTACPGQAYDLMAEFRTDIQALMNKMNSGHNLRSKEGPWHS